MGIIIIIFIFVAFFRYLFDTQDVITGGFSKWPGSTPDPFHTYFSLCGLSFINEYGLNEVMPSLNISQRAYARLQEIQSKWPKSTNEAIDTRVDIESLETMNLSHK